MPIYEIELDDGRVAEVDADSQELALQAIAPMLSQREVETKERQPSYPERVRNRAVGAGETAMAIGETAMAIGSGLGTSSAAGILGLGGEAIGKDGADIVRDLQERFTYQPRTDKGKEYTQNVGTAVNTPAAGIAGIGELLSGNGLDQAVDTIERSQQVGAGKVLGDKVMDATGSPLAATAAEVTPDALLAALGIRGPKAVANRIDSLPIDEISGNIRQAANQAKVKTRGVVEAFNDRPQSPKKREIGARINEGSKDSDLAEFKLKEVNVWDRMTGKKPGVEKDKVAIEAINQGFDKGVIQSVKQASRRNKNKMKIMVASKKKGILNQEEGAINRPSNIAGKSVGDMVREVDRKRKYAGSELETIANSLKNKTVNDRPVIDSFVRGLAEDGIKLEPAPGGKMFVNFKGSDIEGFKPAESAIRSVVNRMNDTDVNTAFDAHRLKQFIYNQAKIGQSKTSTGFMGGVDIKLSGLAKALDGLLDEQFPQYKRVNEQYAAARQAVDAIEGIADKKLDMNNAFKDNNYGTLLRRTMSEAVSKDRLMDALKQVQEVANSKGYDLLDPNNPGKFTGKTFDDNLIAQALFVNELDVMFKPSARTSLGGVVGQALERSKEASQSSATLGMEAVKLVGKGYDKVRGINDEGAFKAIIKLLEEP